MRLTVPSKIEVGETFTDRDCSMSCPLYESPLHSDLMLLSVADGRGSARSDAPHRPLTSSLSDLLCKAMKLLDSFRNGL